MPPQLDLCNKFGVNLVQSLTGDLVRGKIDIWWELSLMLYVLDICYNIKLSPALVIMVVVCGSLQNKFSSESHKRKDSSF